MTYRRCPGCGDTLGNLDNDHYYHTCDCCGGDERGMYPCYDCDYDLCEHCNAQCRGCTNRKKQACTNAMCGSCCNGCPAHGYGNEIGVGGEELQQAFQGMNIQSQGGQVQVNIQNNYTQQHQYQQQVYQNNTSSDEDEGGYAGNGWAASPGAYTLVLILRISPYDLSFASPVMQWVVRPF